MDFSTEEACYIIEHYFCSNSVNMVRKRFRDRFGNTHTLHMIGRVVDCFRMHMLGGRKEAVDVFLYARLKRRPKAET